MTEFFKSQMDYVYFFYGLGFFILAAACFLLFKMPVKKLPWQWLGLFGFIHGLREWLDMVAFSVFNPPIFQYLRLIVLIISLVCLFEFARSGMFVLSKKSANPWIYVPIFSIILFGLFYGGIVMAEIFSRYLLGVIGGMWVACILFFRAEERKTSHQSLWLILASLCFVAYALSQLVGPKASFLPASFINADSFLRILGIPIVVLRGFLAILIAGIFWVHWFFVELGTIYKFRTKVIQVVMAFSFLVLILFGGWILTEERGAVYEQGMRKDLLSRTRTAAAAINPARVKTLTGSPEDIGSPDFERLKEQLVHVNRANPYARYLYLMGMREQKIFFYLDIDISAHPDNASPGMSYDDAPPNLFNVFLTGKESVEGPYVDQWGQWISAFVPVRDFKTNELLAVFGMDRDAKEWAREVLFLRFIVILVLMGVSLTLGIVFVFLQLNMIASEKVKFSEKTFRTIFDGAPEGVFVFDTMEHRMFSVNKFMVSLLGYEEKDFLKLSYEDLLAPGQVDVNKNIQRVLKEGYVFVPERIYKKKDGTYITVEAMATPLEYYGRKAILVFVRDITQRRQFEEKIRQLSRAVEQSPSTVAITDLEGNLEYVNPKFTQLTGYTLDEVKGKNPRVLKSGDKGSEVYKNLWETIVAGNEWRGEFLNKKKNGEVYWEYASISPIRDAVGKTTHYIKVAEDVTERKRLEKVKDDFVSMVSHELRTPLTAIKESINIVYDGSAGEINAEQKDFIETAKRNVDRLARLINDVLDFQKLQSGRMEFYSQETDLPKLLDEVYSTMMPLARNKGLDLLLNVSPRLPLVHLDKDKIIQVLTNLINNAIKFTDQGKVTVVAMHEGPNAVRISVSDTGIGIKQDDIPKLFSSFSQVAPIQYKKTGSTGLGLVISKEIVQKHGGKIWIESEFGKGTTFHFVLPIMERRER